MNEPTYYPLSSIQNGLAFLFRFYPDLHILNLALRMDFESEINEETMAQAVREVGKRVTYLRVRLHMQDEETMVQYLSDEEPAPCEVVDLSDRTEEEIGKIMFDWTYNAFPNSILDTQLYFFKIVRLPGGRRSLYFCGEHFILDGYSMLFMLNYLDRVYAALDTGSELPEPTPMPWKQVESDLSFYSSERYQRELARALKEFETEPHFTSINGLGSPEFIEGQRYGKGLSLTQFDGARINRGIPSELVRRVDETAKTLNISSSMYYLLALRSFLGHVSGTEDVTIITSVTARVTKYEKSCGLDFATQQVLRSVISGETRFVDALLQLSDTQNNVLRHSHAHSIDVSRIVHERYDVPFGCNYYTTQYSYLPLFDLSRQYLKFMPSYVSNGQSNQPFYMLVLPETAKGSLCATYVYSKEYTDPANIERFHAFMLKFIEAGLLEPEASVAELIEKSLD